jgi:hypothetical protein
MYVVTLAKSQRQVDRNLSPPTVYVGKIEKTIALSHFTKVIE